MSNYHQFEMKLKQCKTLLELKRVLMEYLNQVGIRTFSFTLYNNHSKAKNLIKYQVSSENLKSWHEHYIESGFHSIDTTSEYVFQTDIPAIWDIHQQLREARTQKEKKMREDSLEFGAEKGISVPVHGPHGDFSILMVEKLKSDPGAPQWEELRFTLWPAAHLYYHYLSVILLKEAKGSAESLLSKREQQCLILLSESCSVAEMARQLKITERTVNFHMQNIIHKLHVKNKYQALTKALELGLIR